MTLAERLRELIDACFTGLWVQSHEHDDALNEIARLCDVAGGDAEEVRVALGAELGATMQRLQSALKPPERRQERRWEGWLTHAAAVAAGSALTVALTASFCSR